MQHLTTSLAFTLPRALTPEALRPVFARVASALTGRPCAWVLQHRTKLDDENFGSDVAYEAYLTGDGAGLREKVACGPGNPRDGWGYETTVTLQVPELHAQVWIHDFAWEPLFSELRLVVEGLEASAVERLRLVLVAVVAGMGK